MTSTPSAARSVHVVLLGRFGVGDVEEDATARIVTRALRARSHDVTTTLASFACPSFRDLESATVDAGDDAALARAIASADLVVVAGAPWHDATALRLDDVCRAEAATPAAQVARALLRAAAAGVPSALFAIGVPPAAGERPHLAGFLASLAAHVSVRDDESAAALRAAGFTGALVVTADPAFGVVPETALVPTPRGRPVRVGVVPSATVGSPADQALAAAVSVLAARRSLEVVTVRDFDTATLALDADALLVVDATEPAAVACWLGSCDVVATASVQGAILAAVAGTPAVGIGTDRSPGGRAQAGERPDRMVALDTAATDAAARALEGAIDGRTGLAAPLAARVDVARVLLAADGDGVLAAARGASTPAAQRIAALERVSDRVRSRLEQREESWRTLSAFLGRDVDLTVPALPGATQRSRDVDVLRRRAEAAEAELAAIKRTPGWRLLHGYGVFKHHYLFPALRRLRRRAASANPSPGADGAPAAMPLPPGTLDVVCFPIIDWDFRFQRPQQLMTRFAAAGHRVFYVEPRFAPPGTAPAVTLKAPNVHLVRLAGPPRDVWKDALEEPACDELFASLNRLRVDCGLGATLAVVQLPFWWPLAARARERLAWPIWYDCMDHHAGFSTFTGATAADEEALFARADLVSVSSPLLAEQARRHRAQTLLLRNGCDFDHFATAASAPRTRGTRPVVGFFGAIAHWFDGDLVADLAERRPDWDFVLVGSTDTGEIARLEKLPNVTLPGEQPYADLPAWLATFDVTLLPFKRLPLTEATNPVKAYETLASGKPMISVPLPEMRLLGDLVRLAETAEEFEREIVAALEPADAAHIDARRAFASANTWQARYEELAPLVPPLFPRASTVIVTHDNLALNRRCLQEVLARTEWPNHEVIVVDNASTDGTREYLATLAADRPDVVVVANDENLGFAKACNQGLAQATGAYLALLNNDTVVTRGWLSTLIRHLHAAPDVGLIGPATNEIGNEAKVAVGYATLADMPAWAARFTHEHADRLRGMSMLAMFCVATRRAVFDEIGPLDERFEIGMFEDDDYARRMHNGGYRVAVAMDAFVHHVGGASFKRLDDTRYREIFERNRRAYERKWGPWAPHQDDAAAPRIVDLGRRLRDIVEASGVRPSDVFVFPRRMRDATGHVRRVERVAAALAERGMLVFVDEEWDGAAERDGFHPIARNLWGYRGPRGVLEHLDAPVVWVFAYNALDAFRWLDRTVLYDASDDPSGFPVDADVLRHRHEHMLRDADLVVCATESQAREIAAQRPDVVPIAAPETAAEVLRARRRVSRRAQEPRVPAHADRFVGHELRRGTCNVCGLATAFYFKDPALHRESLTCGDCLTTSRYRSIARGVLRAVREFTGIVAPSLADLAKHRSARRLRIYDTQVPFAYLHNAYPLPELLDACDWIDVATSTLRLHEPLGTALGHRRSNQNLERLTFPDASFDLVITSDVLEHVRLHERALREIRRVLAPGGSYLFTVPHDRTRAETLIRVAVVDPEDPSRDEFLLEPEYHGDANSEDNAALAYRTYGRDLDTALARLGFDVEYTREDIPETGILDTELFYCRAVRTAAAVATDSRHESAAV